MYRPVHTSWYLLVCTDQYIQVQTSTYQHIPAHACIFWLVLVCTSIDQQFLDSKKLQTGFEPMIFCILFACFTTALQVHSKQIPGI